MTSKPPDRRSAAALPVAAAAAVPAVAAEVEAGWWAAWRQQHDLAARTALIGAYLPHARLVAAVYYKRRIHDEIGFEDYFQLASLGLVESIDRYLPEQGVLFKTFSTRRMHGAILDGLDAMSEKNRQIAVRRKLQAERLARLADRTQAEGSRSRTVFMPALPAAATGSPAASQARHQENLFRTLAQIGIGTALGILLEDTGMIAGAAAQDQHAVAAAVEVSYFRKTELQHLRGLLRSAVAQLDQAERRVIQAHYLEELAFGEIAATMGVKRARICQLHRQALQKLHQTLAGKTGCDVTM
ncbi:MAG: sigma-70 family RNA polymerase sigma factor [Janthinobacterium lividum]